MALMGQAHLYEGPRRYPEDTPTRRTSRTPCFYIFGNDIVVLHGNLAVSTAVYTFMGILRPLLILHRPVYPCTLSSMSRTASVILCFCGCSYTQALAALSSSTQLLCSEKCNSFQEKRLLIYCYTLCACLTF